LASEERLQVEVHLLDFQGDLYGRQLEFQFATRLRAEQRFEGREALSRQIALDVQKAREFLAQWSA
jgi:riboflavin kinase/FMN adenylyltransferase